MTRLSISFKEGALEDVRILFKIVATWYVGCRYSDRTRSACLREGQYQQSTVRELTMSYRFALLRRVIPGP